MQGDILLLHYLSWSCFAHIYSSRFPIVEEYQSLYKFKVFVLNNLAIQVSKEKWKLN